MSAEDWTLNNANSKLLLNSITVDNVSTTSDSLGLDVDANSTVTSLSVANITPAINCMLIRPFPEQSQFRQGQ